MDTMKWFAKIAIAFVLLFIFVSIIGNGFLKTAFKTIENYEIQSEELKINITEARASKENGYIKGSIINNTEKVVDDKYIKVEFYSKNDVNLGTEYYKISNLDINATKDFDIQFEYRKVDSFKVSISDKAETKNENILNNPSMRFLLFVAGFIMLISW